MAAKEKRDLRQELADELVRRIEAGTAPWQKPWEAGDVQPPVNAITGKPYRGVNYQNLMTFSPDPTDNRWCTYKAAKEQGWQVREGSAGIPIEVWKEYEHKRTEEEMARIRAEVGPDKDVKPTERRLGVRYYTVFHASQIDGIPPLERPARSQDLEGKPDLRIDALAEAVGVSVGRGGGKAFYRPGDDHVQMPPVESFRTATGHDTTFLHELSHATGHEQRMNREIRNNFGDPKYAIEELRAEMSAAMTAAAMGIGFDPESQNIEEGREVGNSAAYLASWLGTMPEKDRKQIIVQAIKDAQGISDYLMERVPEIERSAPEQGRGQDPEVSTIQEPSIAVDSGEQDIPSFKIMTSASVVPVRATVFANAVGDKMAGRLDFQNGDSWMSESLDFIATTNNAGNPVFVANQTVGDRDVEVGLIKVLMDDGSVSFSGAISSARVGETLASDVLAAMVPNDAMKEVLQSPLTPNRTLALIQEHLRLDLQRGLDMDVVNFLAERNRVRQGEHPDYVRFGDPVANAEYFVQHFSRRNPEQAQQWVAAIRSNLEGYSNAVGLSADSMSSIASRMEESVQRIQSPQVGDLVRFEPNDPNELKAMPFSGRVIAALDTNTGDVRYHLQAETGPDQGIEARVYGRDGRFREIDLDQAAGFDRALAAEAEKAPRIQVGDFVITRSNQFGAEWNAPSIVTRLDDSEVRLQDLYRSGQEWEVAPTGRMMSRGDFDAALRHQVSGVVPPEIALEKLDSASRRDSAASRDRFIGAVRAFDAEHGLLYGKAPEPLTKVPDDVRPFLGSRQASVTDKLLRGSEEKSFFSDKMQELREIIRRMPATYETDGKPDSERPVSLRYFGPNGAQWFIIEKDRGDPENEGLGFPRQTQAFGLADLGMGYPEMGYINIPEITRAGAELDYHFTPATLLEIKREHYPELVREGAPVSRGDYVRYKNEIGQELEGVVLDDAQPGEATRLRHITRWPNGTPLMDPADHIMPVVLPEVLDAHLVSAVRDGVALNGVDSRTNEYKLTMGSDMERRKMENRVLMDVERARGIYPTFTKEGPQVGDSVLGTLPPKAQAPDADPPNAFGERPVETLSRSLESLEKERMVVRQKDATDKSVSVREYLDAGLNRGMTSVEDKGNAVRWYNPVAPQFSRTITDERLANVLRQAAAVNPDIGKAIQSVQRSKNTSVELA